MTHGKTTHADKRMNPIILEAIPQISKCALIRECGFESRIRFWPWWSLHSVNAPHQ